MKSNNKILLLMIISFFCLNLKAQSDKASQQILEDCVSFINSTNGIKTNFLLSEIDSNNKESYNFDGELKLKGEKFFLKIPDAQIWYNGKEQWSWINNSDEVNLTTPSSDEIMGLNPVSLLEIYKHGAQVKFLRNEIKDNKNLSIIEILPTKLKLPWVKIVLSIDSKNHFPYTIRMIDENNVKTNIQFTSLQKNLNYDNSSFEFDKKKHPQIEVIDLR